MSDVFVRKIVDNYSSDDVLLIKSALKYADFHHKGQFRKSGEPYIIHPVSVAFMLCDLNADANTICAALLHDIIEDTEVTYNDLKTTFNEDIANLVDGVTKIKNNEHSSKEEEKAKYIRKLTTSILSDVRIMIIKLMDRLHNMETLNYQSPSKQIKIAKETLDIYVPIAHYLGIYKIRFLLEDLSFKYLDETNYNLINKIRENIVLEGNVLLDSMIEILKKELALYKIDAILEKNTKNIYGIHKRLLHGTNIKDISDILRVKVITNNFIECYQVLGIIHKIFRPVNGRFKDYISNPKTNRYQSLHTTVYTPKNQLVQFQIRTKEMNDVNQYGIITAWFNNESKNDIIRYLFNNYPFVSVLKDINELYKDDLEFMEKLEHEVLKEKVYIVIGNGNILELPVGFTLIDLCNKLGISDVKVQVNNEDKDLDYILKSNDFVSFTRNKVKRK